MCLVPMRYRLGAPTYDIPLSQMSPWRKLVYCLPFIFVRSFTDWLGPVTDAVRYDPDIRARPVVTVVIILYEKLVYPFTKSARCIATSSRQKMIAETDGIDLMDLRLSR